MVRDREASGSQQSVGSCSRVGHEGCTQQQQQMFKTKVWEIKLLIFICLLFWINDHCAVLSCPTVAWLFLWLDCSLTGPVQWTPEYWNGLSCLQGLFSTQTKPVSLHCVLGFFYHLSHCGKPKFDQFTTSCFLNLYLIEIFLLTDNIFYFCTCLLFKKCYIFLLQS